MNTLYKGALVALLALSTSSCSGFLDKEPHNALSPSTTWKTPQDAQKFLIGCYDGWVSGATILYLDCMSDFGFNFHVHEGYRSIGNGSMTPSNPGVSFYDYSTIGRCNLLLERIKDIPFTDEAERKDIIAQAKVIRAYQYYTMNIVYGGVPIIELPQTAEAAQLPRKTEAEVRAYIAKDLDEALPDLQKSPAARGRFGKGMALALRMREALYYGDWAIAREKAKAIMDLGIYELEADYARLFKIEGQDSKEIIAAVQYLDNTKPLYTVIGSMYNNATGGWSSLVPTPNLLDTYEMANGMTITESGSGYDPAHPFKGRDPRMAKTICYPGADYIRTDGLKAIYNSLDKTLDGKNNPDYPEAANNSSKTGLTWNKYTYPATQYTDVWSCNACPIVFRYAEVLLTLAEASNELSGPSAEVYSALDQVRRRAGLPAVDRSKYASKDKLRELIHRERSVELAGEGFRRMDIVRWKASDGKMLAEHVLNAPLERVVGTVDSRISDPTMRATIKVSATAAEKKVEDRSFKPHYRYLPIPQAVLDRNPNFGKNNPDY